MPLQIRKLSQDKAVKVFPRRGQMDLSEYVQAISALQPGDTAAMDLANLTTRAAKRRLGQAAAQLGRRLHWAHASEPDVVYFQLLAGSHPRKQGLVRRPRSTAVAGAPLLQKTPTAPQSGTARGRRGRRRDGGPSNRGGS